MSVSTIPDETVDEGQAVDALTARVTALEAELAEARSSRVSVTREPLTYEAHLVPDRRNPSSRGFRAVGTRESVSYVQDLVAQQTRTGDYVSAERRLSKHAREMETLATERNPTYPDGMRVAYEQRTISWGTGQGGYFAPPLWLVEQFAMIPTPERVLSERAPKFDLPMGAQTINVPRLTAGAVLDVSSLGSATTDVDLVDAAASSAVTTIAGNADVPMQMLEQSPQGAHLDWLVFTAMEASYGFQLESQMISGQGTATPQYATNNQLLGLLNNTAVPAGNIVTYTDAAPVPGKMIEGAAQTGGGPAAQVIAAVGNTRKLPPECWLMRTSRGTWLSSGAFQTPMALTNEDGPGVIAILGYDAYPDEAVPSTLGATANQDTLIACRPSDWLVLESEPRTGVYTDVLSGVLNARLQMRRYAAAILRYPSSVGWLTGTGMVVQAGF